MSYIFAVGRRFLFFFTIIIVFLNAVLYIDFPCPLIVPKLYNYNFLFSIFRFDNAADSGHESTESDDEFQICEICSSEEVNSF